jgi:hypothetical protein
MLKAKPLHHQAFSDAWLYVPEEAMFKTPFDAITLRLTPCPVLRVNQRGDLVLKYSLVHIPLEINCSIAAKTDSATGELFINVPIPEKPEVIPADLNSSPKEF